MLLKIPELFTVIFGFIGRSAQVIYMSKWNETTYPE